MLRKCTVCQEDKPVEDFPKRLSYCRTCYNQKRKLKRDGLENEYSSVMTDVYSLEKIIPTLTENDDIDDIMEMLEKIKINVSQIREKKLVLSLPITIPDAAFQYFKRCAEMGVSITNMQNRMYVKCDEDYFKETYGVERPEFIKVSHELSFLIDYIRCLKDAYNQFIEDHNFATRQFNPTYEKIKDIQTIYNFSTKSIEMTDNPLRLDRKTFLRKLRDETQNHHGLMYFHQKHYFDRWYEEYSV